MNEPKGIKQMHCTIQGEAMKKKNMRIECPLTTSTHCTHTDACARSLHFRFNVKWTIVNVYMLEQQKRPHGKCNIVKCVCVCEYGRMKRACLD